MFEFYSKSVGTCIRERCEKRDLNHIRIRHDFRGDINVICVRDRCAAVKVLNILHDQFTMPYRSQWIKRSRTFYRSCESLLFPKKKKSDKKKKS